MTQAASHCDVLLRDAAHMNPFPSPKLLSQLIMMDFTKRTALLGMLFAAFAVSTTAQEKKPPKITFDDHVQPIFAQKCASCHNPDKKSADLDLTTYSSLMQGGASGGVIEAGDSAASYLYELVTHEAEPAMPPESPKIPDQMIETLRKWIDGGVLENMGSKAKASKKKKYDLALSAPSTERPAVVPMPGRLSLQPVTFSPTKTAVDALATSPWAPLAAVGSHQQVLLYNTQTLALVGVLPFPEGAPKVLKFSRNGGLLLAGGGVGGASGRVVVWNIKNGERIIEIGSELDEVLAADISSDQTLIALGGPQRVVRIYSTDTGQLLHEIRKHTEWVTSLEFSPDSVLLASGDRNGGLFVWEGWTGREYLTLKGHTKGITSVSWRGDSNILASSSDDTTIKLWEMENGGNVKSWGADGAGATCVEFTRDGRLFSSGRDKVAKLWDQNGAQQRAFEAFGDLALQATYCDETNRGIAGDWTGEIRVWNAADGARVGQLLMNAPKLEDRLASAQQLMTTKQSEHQPIQAAYNNAKTVFDQIKTQHTAALKVATDSKAAMDQANVALTAAKTLLAQVTQEHATAKQQAETMAKGMPQLKEAADKAAIAAQTLPDNQQLAAAAKIIADASSAKAAQLTAMQKTAADKAAAMAKAQQDMVVKQNTATDNTNTYNVAVAKEKELMPKVKPAEDAMNTEKVKFDKVTAELTSAQQLVSRWNDEIAFTKRLTDLTNQRVAAQKILAEREESHAVAAENQSTADAALAKANQDLATVKTTIDSYAKHMEAAQAAIQAAKQSQTNATNAKNEAITTMNQMTGLIAKLNEAAGKTNEAVQLAKEDAKIAQALASIQAIVAEKNKVIEAMKADVAAKTAAEQTEIAKVAAAEKSATELTAQKAAAEAKMPELTAAIPPLQQKATEAKAAADAAVQTVSHAQQSVETISKQIAQAQGLAPAA